MEKYRYQIVRDYKLRETVKYPDDPALRDTVLRYGEELGDHGRFTLKFVGIDRRIEVLIEADSEELSRQYAKAFQDFLERGGYLTDMKDTE